MLSEQIKVLQEKEDTLVLEIAEYEEMIKKAKNELTLIKRAKQSLEKLEEQLNGQANLSE